MEQLQPHDIAELGNVLSCVQLSELTLEQLPSFTSINVTAVAKAVGHLLRRQPCLTHLTFKYLTITSQTSNYCLPHSLIELHIYGCSTHFQDWNDWSKTSTESTIKVLNVMNCTHETGGNEERFFKFIKKHSKTLISLKFHNKGQQPTSDTIIIMAQHLGSIHVLQEFEWGNLKLPELLDMLRKAIPWFASADCFQNFSLFSESSTEPDNNNFAEAAKKCLTDICTLRQRPLRHARVHYSTGAARGNDGRLGGGVWRSW